MLKICSGISAIAAGMVKRRAPAGCIHHPATIAKDDVSCLLRSLGRPHRVFTCLCLVACIVPRSPCFRYHFASIVLICGTSLCILERVDPVINPGVIPSQHVHVSTTRLRLTPKQAMAHHKSRTDYPWSEQCVHFVPLYIIILTSCLRLRGEQHLQQPGRF